MGEFLTEFAAGDEIDEDDFVNWFDKVDKEVKKELVIEEEQTVTDDEAEEAEAKKEEKKEETADDAEKDADDDKADAMETDTKEEEGDASPKEKEKKTKIVKVKKLDEKLVETFEISADDARGAFKLLVGEDVSQIEKAAFLRYVRTVMRVIKTTAMTEGMSIETKTTKRMDVHDVVEVLSGPTWCETSWVLRIHARLHEVEGYVTVSGNQGSVFLREGGNRYKVLKATELDEVMEEEKEEEKPSEEDAEK